MADPRADEDFDDELVDLVEQIVQSWATQRRGVRDTATVQPPDTATRPPSTEPEPGPASEPHSSTDAEANAETRSGAEPQSDMAGDDPEARTATEAQQSPETKVSAKARARTKAPDEAEAGSRVAAGGDGEAEVAGRETADEGTASAEEAVRRGRLPRLRVSRTGAVIAGLTIALMAATGVAVAEHFTSTGDGRLEVEQRASLVANTLYTYDYRDVSGYLKAQQDVLTKAAEATVKPNWSALTTMIQSGKYVSRPQIQQVYVGDISKSRATVVVVTDIKLTTAEGVLNSIGATLQFTLEREGGRWLAGQIPTLLTPGTQTQTDLQGNPIKPSASAGPSAGATPKN